MADADAAGIFDGSRNVITVSVNRGKSRQTVIL